MTKQELFEAWERYMHRRDLAADLDLTYTLAAERVSERLMFTDTDIPAILANSPRMLLHAGLIQLAELAQDTEQEMREMRYFEDAVADYSFRSSINNVDAVTSNPHYPEA